MQKKYKFMLWAVLIIFVLILISFLGASLYLRKEAPKSLYDYNLSHEVYPEFDHEISQIQNKKGEKIEIVTVKNSDSKYTILYLHGNAGRTYPIISELSKFGTVVSPAYPGYSRSEGTPNQENIYETVDLSIDFVVNTLKVPKENIIIYGHSMGGSPAIYGNNKYGDQIRATILVNTFDSVRSMCSDDHGILCWSIFDLHNSLNMSKGMKGKVYQYHSPSDMKVSFDKGKRLSEEISKHVEAYTFTEIEGEHSAFDISKTILPVL